MRIGKVLSYNKRAGVGLISDNNGERIIFFSKNSCLVPSRGDIVTFEIHFTNGSLTVRDIAILKLCKTSRSLRVPGIRYFQNPILSAHVKVYDNLKNETI